MTFNPLRALLPDWYGCERLLVDVSQFLHDHDGSGEDPVGVQEGVEEVYGEEAQVGQPLQQPLHAGVTDLRNLAGVERLTEANVNIIFMETRIRSNEEHNQSIFTVCMLCIYVDGGWRCYEKLVEMHWCYSWF